MTYPSQSAPKIGLRIECRDSESCLGLSRALSSHSLRFWFSGDGVREKSLKSWKRTLNAVALR